MSDFYDDITAYLEENAVKLMQSFSLDAKRNNIINKTAPDLEINGKLFDFQWSSNFKKYGDLRIDIISAYSVAERQKLYSDIKQNIDNYSDDIIKYLKSIMTIQKKGKIFDKSIYGLIYFFYNEKINIHDGSLSFQNNPPDFIVCTKRKDLLKYINKNFTEIIRSNLFKLNYKIGNRTGFGDFHGSAFVCIKLDDLEKHNIISKFECKKFLERLSIV